jgi:flagellar basal body rod protein FlgB
MTLATVAYRISTDVSFAELLQKNTEEALQQAGITLEKTEKKALETLLSLPEAISKAGNYMLTTEPWAA